MADFNLLIRERLFTDSNPRGGDYNLTISNVTYSDNRVLTVPSGSETTIFNIAETVGPGQIISSSLKYARITNLNTTHSINLSLYSGSGVYKKEVVNFDQKPGGTFMLSSADFTSSIDIEGVNEDYGQISSVTAFPSGSVGKMEYFLVCN